MHWSRLFAATLVIAAGSGSAFPADYFLTIGGGYSPSGNQVSLEKNTVLFQRMLCEFYPEGVDHTIFFADGGDAGRDLQFVDPAFEIPQANLYLARLFNQEGEIDYQYRDHEIDGVAGPSAKPQLDKWFKEVGSRLHAGDRLFVYATAHGGKSPDDKQPHDTVLYLWNHQQLRMHDFTALLDEIDDEVPVVLVMVQCYSGGFTHVIFEEGNAEKGVSPADRCGFYATVHDRVAAGCTPDIDEANYHEFSTSFFEALRGKTRYDEPVERPDFDGDGRTSFAEAYAHVVLTSNTIDIPVRTSDAFLRKYSTAPAPPEQAQRPGRRRRGGRPAQDAPAQPPVEQKAEAVAEPSGEKSPSCQDAPPSAEPVEEDNGNSAVPGQPAPEERPLLKADSPYPELLAAADAIDRAILEGLSRTLDLTADLRAQVARAKGDELQKERQRVEKERNDLQGEFNQIRDDMKRQMLAKWPEAGNRWHPVACELLSSRSEELVGLVESHPKFGRLEELTQRIGELDTQKMDLERQWVKCQRLLRALETVALAGNLTRTAPEMCERFARLRASESGFFGPAGGTAAGEGTTVSQAP